MFDGLHDTRSKKSPLYSSSFIWFALFGLMRYNSLQLYLLRTEFELPSLLFLRNISQRKFDAFSTLKAF